MDTCNEIFSTLTPKSLARRAFILDHSYIISSPSKLIKHKIKNSKNIKINQTKSRRMVQKCRRQIKVIKKIKLLLSILKRKCGIQEKLTSYLEHTFPTAMSEIFNRYKKGGRKCYSPSLIAFALTLNFYSPKAYNFVREQFGLSIPHAATLRSWYHEIKVEEGFTEESFTAFKYKSLEYRQNGKNLYCSMIFDEMHIKRQIEWDGKKLHGFSSIGTSSDPVLRAATQVLVILVVALDSSWKVPISYFFSQRSKWKRQRKINIRSFKKTL